MADGKQVGPGLYVKLGMDLTELVGSAGAAAIVLNQSLDLFQKFERYGQQAFDNTVGKAIEYQEAIDDLHNTLGLTNTDAQKWKSTLVSFDTDIGSFSASLRYLTVRISDTGASGDSLRATLKGIGVESKDAAGNYRAASDVMQDVLVALSQIPPGTERASKAAEIYGRNWYSIAELIDGGTEAVKKFKEQQPLFSDDELERIDKAKIKMGEFNQKLDAIGAKTGSWALENHGISSLLDYLSWSGEYAENEAKWNAYQTALKEGYSGDYNSWVSKQADKTHAEFTNKIINDTIGGVANLTDKYAGLTDAQIELIETEGLLAEAEKNRAAATNQTDYDKYSKEIQGYKNRMEELATSISKVSDATKEATSSAAKWSSSSVVGSAGSEMQLFLQREMELGTSYQDALNNWAHGSPTRGDAAAGTLGALSAKGKSSSSTKTVTPGSTGQTDAVKTEYDAQGKALETLTDKTTKEYQKQSDAFKKCLDDMQAFRERQYPILETLDLTHFATFEETARVGQQKVLDNMAQLVNFAGTNPIIQNFIVMSKKGPDWSPPTFTPIAAPTLESADFTQVGAAVQAIVAKGLGDGTSGSKAAEAAGQKVTVVVQDKTSGGVKASLASVNGGVGGRS